MKKCPVCYSDNPPAARYCMQCGQNLEVEPSAKGPPPNSHGSRVFFLTLFGSLLLSLVLIGVFHLPVFILAAFLPLFWTKGRSRR